MKNEEWKIIKNCDEYAISNYGRVKSSKRLKNEDKKDINKWRILKPRYKKLGYTFVSIYDNDGMLHQYTIHRLVAIHFIPKPNNLPLVNHINEIKDCNYVQNLEWCDNRYNSSFGSCSHKIIYNDKLYLSASIFAKELGVAVSSITNYINGKGNLPKKIKDIKFDICKVTYINI